MRFIRVVRSNYGPVDVNIDAILSIFHQPPLGCQPAQAYITMRGHEHTMVIDAEDVAPILEAIGVPPSPHARSPMVS